MLTCPQPTSSVWIRIDVQPRYQEQQRQGHGVVHAWCFCSRPNKHPAQPWTCALDAVHKVATAVEQQHSVCITRQPLHLITMACCGATIIVCSAVCIGQAAAATAGAKFHTCLTPVIKFMFAGAHGCSTAFVHACICCRGMLC